MRPLQGSAAHPWHHLCCHFKKNSLVLLLSTKYFFILHTYFSPRFLMLFFSLLFVLFPLLFVLAWCNFFSCLSKARAVLRFQGKWHFRISCTSTQQIRQLFTSQRHTSSRLSRRPPLGWGSLWVHQTPERNFSFSLHFQIFKLLVWFHFCFASSSLFHDSIALYEPSHIQTHTYAFSLHIFFCLRSLCALQLQWRQRWCSKQKI